LKGKGLAASVVVKTEKKMEKIVVEIPSGILQFLRDMEALTKMSPEEYIARATVHEMFAEVEDHIIIEERVNRYGLKEIFETYP